MKVKPQQYAQMLIEALTEKTDKKKIAERFWHLLQKNKQYKDLPKILELIDIEYAKQNGLKIAKVYSQTALGEEEIKEIELKLNKKYSSNVSEKSGEFSPATAGSNNKFIIKNFVENNYAGIIVKVDDKIIDLSILGKINNLKKRLDQAS